MEFMFSSPQSPKFSSAGASVRKRRGSTDEGNSGVFDFTNAYGMSPLSSPKARNGASTLSVRTSLEGGEITGLGSGSMSPPRPRSTREREGERNLPGWATPPKLRLSKSPHTSPKGTKSPSRRTSGGFADRDRDDLSSSTPPHSGNSSLSSSFDYQSAMPDRYIPNRDTVDIDFAGHLLSRLSDENVATDQLGGVGGISQITKASKINSSASRTHLGVISNANNVNSSGRLLSCFQQTSSSSERAQLRDDGFCRIKEEKANSESAVPVTGAAAALSAAGGVSIGAFGSSNSPSSSRSSRFIPNQSSRILDAPDLMDDYYLNLLSWGSNNVIAVALNQSVYLWHAADGHIDNLLTLGGDDYVTSVQWSGVGENTVAVGTSSSVVELWDTSALTKVRDLSGHSNRVSSLSWNGSSNPNLLSSGSRDSTIINHDIRASRNVQSTFQGHTQEICGLSWSPDGSTLASGGNENRLCIWDAAMSAHRSNSVTSNVNSTTPRFMIEQHNAAVKAVSWCPWQRNILASGGGTADRTIRVWNTATGNNLRTMDTGSQVCAIQWSLTEKELVSSHGFSDNQIILWKYGHRSSSLTKIREFHGHTSRVLHLARSPDGATICSASADETIRFWDIFGPSTTGRRSSGSGSGTTASPKKSGTSGSNGSGIQSSLGHFGGMLFNSGSSTSSGGSGSMLNVR